ncbi:hypothetical protein IPM09_01305 [Candidatus Saccharibacteria bacterium]|nr:MAG: hypothetical protein IPM09_01305 [Candidatus Saccharibacteria bacterium]
MGSTVIPEYLGAEVEELAHRPNADFHCSDARTQLFALYGGFQRGDVDAVLEALHYLSFTRRGKTCQNASDALALRFKIIHALS